VCVCVHAKRSVFLPERFDRLPFIEVLSNTTWL
jgi:hypothetical protein